MDKEDKWIKFISVPALALAWAGWDRSWDTKRASSSPRSGDTGGWSLANRNTIIVAFDFKYKYKVEKYKQTYKVDKYKIAKVRGTPVDEALRDQARGQSC